MTWPNARYAFTSALITSLCLLLGACGDAEPVTNVNKNNNNTCTSRCLPGEVACLNSSTSIACGLLSNGCYDFVDQTRCGADELCQAGECKEIGGEQSNECEPGTARCNLLGQAEVCGDFDDDGFFEFGDSLDCEANQICDPAQGVCVLNTCEDSCAAGQTSCRDNIVRTCARGANGCLQLGAGKDCPPQHTCQNNDCVRQQNASCEDECVAGERVCGPDGRPRVCRDGDNDGCVEFVTESPCGPTQRCDAGSCVAQSTCRDMCARNSTTCLGDLIATCRDTNGDGCVEIDQGSACPTAGQTCQISGGQAVCRAPAMTGKVVINEIFYDPIGPDVVNAGQPDEYSPTFVELYGPPGLSIGNYKIQLNGSNGMPYNSFTLPANAVLDSRGFAIAIMTIPDVYFAILPTNFYEVMTPHSTGQDALRNGANAVVLLNATEQVIDAVGYGNFTGNNVFTGERAAAPATAAGRSVGRKVDGVDTDDNSADFTTGFPTPGLPNSDLFIHEIYFDQPGPDGQPGTIETFVEIAAPLPDWLDFSLDGYTLRAINGADDMDYISTNGQPGIPLNGVTLHGLPAYKGFVVVCNDQSAPTLLPRCARTYTGPDWQNGPDNIALDYNRQRIDAVAYGTFRADQFFRGEGSAAPFTSSNAGFSLSRWPLSDIGYPRDTNNNAADLYLTSPTPGLDNPRNIP